MEVVCRRAQSSMSCNAYTFHLPALACFIAASVPAFVSDRPSAGRAQPDLARLIAEFAYIPRADRFECYPAADYKDVFEQIVLYGAGPSTRAFTFTQRLGTTEILKQCGGDLITSIRCAAGEPVTLYRGEDHDQAHLVWTKTPVSGKIDLHDDPIITACPLEKPFFLELRPAQPYEITCALIIADDNFNSFHFWFKKYENYIEFQHLLSWKRCQPMTMFLMGVVQHSQRQQERIRSLEQNIKNLRDRPTFSRFGR